MSSHHHAAVEYGGKKKTLAAYVTGLLLCIVLTFIAFGLVESKALSDTTLYISLSALAITQLLVQCLCFLRLNATQEGRWNLLPFIFALLIISILVSGSLWIMYNLNINMM